MKNDLSLCKERIEEINSGRMNTDKDKTIPVTKKFWRKQQPDIEYCM